MAIEIDLAIEFEGVFSISKAWSGLFCIRHLLSFQVGFFNWIFNLNWQSHAAIFCFTLKFLIYDFDYKKIRLEFQLGDWIDSSCSFYQSFSFCVICKSTSLQQHLNSKAFKSSPRLKLNSCFDGLAFIINQLRIRTNQNWIKIRFNAWQHRSFLS